MRFDAGSVRPFSSPARPLSRRVLPEQKATAGSGVYARLWRLAEALGLAFPLANQTLRGWGKQSLGHRVNQQIPIRVAEAAHFQCLVETTYNPFVPLICATQWLGMVAMVRDAHMQLSVLVRVFRHAYLCWCNKGKNKGKPFHWILPNAT